MWRRSGTSLPQLAGENAPEPQHLAARRFKTHEGVAKSVRAGSGHPLIVVDNATVRVAPRNGLAECRRIGAPRRDRSLTILSIAPLEPLEWVESKMDNLRAFQKFGPAPFNRDVQG